MLTNERSAEFCRGALHVAEANYLYRTIAFWRALLAAAEARESTHPTAAEVIEAAEKALAGIAGYGDVFAYRVTDRNPADEVRDALAIIARYKEAHGGK